MNGKPPPPLDWHPAYRDRTTRLMDWLEDPDSIHIVALLTEPLQPDDDPPPNVRFRQLQLTKHKAMALAPYVGRPFIYVWPVATDELGRHIAGESRRIYTDDAPWTA